MRNYFFILFCLFSFDLLFAGPNVPEQMEVAGIRLKLTEAARRDIQKDVDALTRSEKYFNIKMERIRMYFPLIEKVFREENVPEDFKYLVIQESALIGDAVSSSDAVGYWQFKEFTGKEVGLRIDRNVDERMHIIEASRGAAKYFKKNNFYFDNWIYALQAYQMGPGGAMKVADKKYYGANKMTINKNTYWYVKKFLAHKIAFEKAYKNNPRNGRMLAEYNRSGNKNIKDISRELEVAEEEMTPYNLWLRRGRIPTDKNYIVLVPVKTMEKKRLVGLEQPQIASGGFKNVYPNENPDLFPLIKDLKSGKNYTQEVIKVNGLPGIIAGDEATFDWLALQGAISTEKFFRYNDLQKGAAPVAGKVYYYKKKRGKARIHYHVVSRGETLWDVSQKYGIRVKKLMQKNRMRKVEPLEEGRILWLRFIRPSDHPIEYKPVPVPRVKAIKEVAVDSIFEEAEPEIYPVDEAATETDSLSMADTVRVEKTSLSDSDTVTYDTTGPDDLADKQPVYSYRDEKIFHTVEKGETLYGISRTYGVPVDDLIRWNKIGIDENYKLGVGEKLTVYQKIPEMDPDVPELKSHKVQAGETLFKISQQYGLTVQELMELNNMKEPNISPGQELNVIEKDEEELPVPEGTLFHEVQPGETLYQIAKKYEMSIQELMELNQKSDFELRVGEKLMISNGKQE